MRFPLSVFGMSPSGSVVDGADGVLLWFWGGETECWTPLADEDGSAGAELLGAAGVELLPEDGVLGLLSVIVSFFATAFMGLRARPEFCEGVARAACAEAECETELIGEFTVEDDDADGEAEVALPVRFAGRSFTADGTITLLFTISAFQAGTTLMSMSMMSVKESCPPTIMERLKIGGALSRDILY